MVSSMLAARETSREEEMGQKKTVEFKYSGNQTFLPEIKLSCAVEVVLLHFKT